ncbi:hypothetical protein LTR28_008864 [Elasticomyces elasticus]|nr:hypothetical protein LTR28_008864 [Elasticomyces elasticus]
MGGAFPPQKLAVEDKRDFLEQLRQATYTACLAAYVQGINTIDHGNRANMWNVDFRAVLQIWRAGCIIQADYIADMLQPVFDRCAAKGDVNLLFEEEVARDLRKGQSALRTVVVEAPPTRPNRGSAPLTQLPDLPTSFYEAELDYFGKHMYDKKGDDPAGLPTEGKHHYEWKPA